MVTQVRRDVLCNLAETFMSYSETSQLAVTDAVDEHDMLQKLSMLNRYGFKIKPVSLESSIQLYVVQLS